MAPHLRAKNTYSKTPQLKETIKENSRITQPITATHVQEST